MTNKYHLTALLFEINLKKIISNNHQPVKPTNTSLPVHVRHQPTSHDSSRERKLKHSPINLQYHTVSEHTITQETTTAMCCISWVVTCCSPTIQQVLLVGFLEWLLVVLACLGLVSQTKTYINQDHPRGWGCIGSNLWRAQSGVGAAR